MGSPPLYYTAGASMEKAPTNTMGIGLALRLIRFMKRKNLRGGRSMEHLLVSIAFIIVAVRSAYLTFTLFQRGKKPWLEILYRAAILIIALSFLF
jgi:hypothetical protein